MMLDAMPIDARILGFANSWQGDAARHAVDVTLPSGKSIRVAAAPYLLATKLEAFQGRGKGDLLGSKDFEDIAALIDGRPSLVEEVGALPLPVRRYIGAETGRLLEHRRLTEALEGTLPMGPVQERAALVIEPRLRELAALGSE